MESDEEDFVFYGTPIEREEEITSRKKKAVAESSGLLRTLPSWKQEVRDEEGRRRFHGAFTGGFSAGYYNTVGSKEGWAPQSFTSSRKSRAEFKRQSILNFLDEDEKSELEGRLLATSNQFDTFGFTAAEIARRQADKEQKQRPSAIPGPPLDELLCPATESIGVKLLQKMGWRHGRSIKDSHTDALYDARREARKAFLAFSSEDMNEELSDNEARKGDFENIIEQPVKDIQSSRNTPVYVLNPKQDLHGLGFDPYKNAPEFRERERSRTSTERGAGHSKGSSLRSSLFGLKSGRIAPGFGIGALEELDAEDEDVYAIGYEDTYVEEVDEPPISTVDDKRRLLGNEQSSLPGFRVGSNYEFQIERFEAPVIPKEFVLHHKFPGPLEIDFKQIDAPPSEVPPPEDNNLKILIEGVASLVARCGKLFEDLSREKNQSNPLFNFLSRGNGHDYYARKLWEAYQRRNDQPKQHSRQKGHPNIQKMTAESRGKLLGERPLERSLLDPSTSVASTTPVINLQFQLSDTFTKPSLSDLQEIEKPFKDDPSKQERFEQFLKEKYEGGLRSSDSGGASNMSEAARARERLDFEAAADAIEKGEKSKESKSSTFNLMEFSTAGAMQFSSGGSEQSKDPQAENSLLKKMYPRREEFQWRPSPLLCKRFDLIDPYMGKPPPPSRIRSKMETLIFTSDSLKHVKAEGTLAVRNDLLPVHQRKEQETDKSSVENEEVQVAVENVGRPVDLYKAIFSDDSDDEVEEPNLNRVENPEKKAEAANTALSRLIAGDFLESLGKELGFEVPPDQPLKPRIPVPQKENTSAHARDDNVVKFKNNSALSSAQVETTPIQGLDNAQDIENGIASQKGETIYKSVLEEGDSKNTRIILSANKSGRRTEMDDVNRKLDTSSKLDQGKSNSSSDDERSRERTKRRRNRKYSSSEDERSMKQSRRHRRGGTGSSSEDGSSRKRSRQHRHRSRYTESDSSGDNQDGYSSKSKGRSTGSSHQKNRESKRHSRQHKHRRRDSPSRSHYGSDRDRADTKSERK